MRIRNLQKWFILLFMILIIIAITSFTQVHKTDSKNEVSLSLKVEELYSFAKLYGYIRFFHPSDEASQIDWNKFAVYGVQQILESNDHKDIKEKLEELFLPIAPTLVINNQMEQPNDLIIHYPEDDPSIKMVFWQHEGVDLDGKQRVYESSRVHSHPLHKQLFEQTPQPHEMIHKSIGNNLYCHFPLVLPRDKNGTLGPKLPEELNRLTQNLDQIDLNQLTIEDLNVRIADVIITWNVMQHFYPYFDVVQVNWEEEIKKALLATLENDHQEYYKNVFYPFLENLKDGHIAIYLQNAIPKKFLPIRADLIEDKVVVVNSGTTEIKPGDIILSINGKNALNFVHEREKLISGSPQFKKSFALIALLYGEPNSKAFLKVESEGKIKEIELTYSKDELLDLFHRPEPFEEIEENIFYMDISRADFKEIMEKNLTRLTKAKGIIVDYRGYPKDHTNSNFIYQFLQHLISEEVETPITIIMQSIYPDQENMSFNESRKQYKPRLPKIEAKVVFLTDSSAISASEHLLGIVEYYKIGEIVGEPTAGANGNVNWIDLPGGLSVRWTGMKILKQDGSQFHMIGIQPTVPVTRTMEGIKNLRDEYLEKALSIIKS